MNPAEMYLVVRRGLHVDLHRGTPGIGEAMHHLAYAPNDWLIDTKASVLFGLSVSFDAAPEVVGDWLDKILQQGVLNQLRHKRCPSPLDFSLGWFRGSLLGSCLNCSLASPLCSLPHKIQATPWSNSLCVHVHNKSILSFTVLNFFTCQIWIDKLMFNIFFLRELNISVLDTPTPHVTTVDMSCSIIISRILPLQECMALFQVYGWWSLPENHKMPYS